MNIGNNVKQQIWNTVLDGYEVNNATDAVKELIEAYFELYEGKDNKDDNDGQLNLIAEENICLRKRLANVARDSLEACIKLKKDQLVKKSFDLDSVAEAAVRLALNGKMVCIAAKEISQINNIGERALQYCSYKNNGYDYHTSLGVIDEIDLRNCGTICLLTLRENSFIGREFHNAFIYMQGIDINDYFYNAYEKLVQRCMTK